MVMTAPERMSQADRKSFWDFIDGLSLRQTRKLIKVLKINERLKDTMTRAELDSYKGRLLTEMLNINGVVS